MKLHSFKKLDTLQTRKDPGVALTTLGVTSSDKEPV
jgi:hypothetical protein